MIRFFLIHFQGNLIKVTDYNTLQKDVKFSSSLKTFWYLKLLSCTKFLFISNC